MSIEALKKLKAISNTKAFNNVGKAGTKKRIEFLTLVIEARLYSDIIDYTYYDSYGLGERTLDTCFEMYDSDQVVAALIEKASGNDYFKALLINAVGNDTYCNWFNRNQKIQDVELFELV